MMAANPGEAPQAQMTAVINLYAMGMAQVLGMSHSEVLERCSIRELLLYAGTLEQAPQPEQMEDPEAAKRRFAEEVLSG